MHSNTEGYARNEGLIGDLLNSCTQCGIVAYYAPVLAIDASWGLLITLEMGEFKHNDTQGSVIEVYCVAISLIHS
jgi:hypothetical protein